MANRLAHLLDVPVPQADPNAAPAGNRLAGAVQRTTALEANLDPEQEAREILDLADRSGSPLASIEAHLPWVQAEDRFVMSSAGPRDWDTAPAARAGNPITLREQIGRMDAVDWAKRVPFSPAGVFDTVDLLAATRRLRQDRYYEETAAAGEKAESREGRMQATNRPRILANPKDRRDADVQRIEQFLLERQEVAERGQTFAAKVFDGASYMPAWMIEFALTGGLGKLGSETAKEIGLRTLQSYAKTTAGRAVLKGAGWTGGAITRTTLGMPHRVGEEILERRIPYITVGPNRDLQIATPAESWATSVAKGWAAAVIESASETTGEGLTAAAKVTSKWVAQKGLARLPFGQRLYDGLRQAWLASHPEPGAAAKFAESFFTRAGYSNILGEIGEERVNTILHGIAGTRQFSTDPNAGYLENLAAGITQDLKIKNLAVEATVLAIPGAAKVAATRLASKSEIRNPKSETEKGAPSDAVQETQRQGPVAPAPGAAPEQLRLDDYAVRDAKGVMDAGQTADRVVARVQQELDAGSQVTLIADFGRKAVPITKVDRGMMADAQGQRWGLMGFFAGDARIEVSRQAASSRPTAPAANEPGILDAAVAAAEGEARAQAAERFQGPEAFTFEDYAGLLQDTSDRELRQMARRLGLKIEGATGETLRKFVGDRIAGLLKAGGEPAAGPAGEKAPGSLPYKQFFARYGAALAEPEAPENKPWLARYAATENERGVKGLYKDLQDEYHRQQAWELFYDLTGQQRPEITPDEPRTPQEAQQANLDAETADTQHVLDDAAGQAPPADLPPTATGVPEGTPEDQRRIGWWSWLLDRLGIRSADGFEVWTAKDFRELYKYLQLPDDIRRTFPAFEPVYQVQRARERAKQVLDRVFAEKLQPYFDLTDGARKAVDALLVAEDQSAADPKVVGPLAGALTPAQYRGYQAVRRSLDDAAEMLVQRMRALGIDEERIAEFSNRIGNYIPHKWYGPWAIVVREKLTPAQMKEQGRRPMTLMMSAVGYTERFREAQRLQELFPGGEVAIIHRTKVPMQAFQDAPAGAVAKMVDLVIEQAQASQPWQQDVSADVKAQLQQAMKDLYKSKGFGMHFIQRNETPGWTEDLRRPLAEYFAGFSGFLTKMEAGLAFTESLQGIDPRRTPNLYKYASDYIRYVMGDEREWNRAKGLFYRWYMFANLKSAATNLTGNLVMGWPVLSKHTHFSLARLMTAMADTAGDLLDEGELAFLAGLEKEGWLDPKMSQEISARGGNALYQAIATPVQQGVSLLDVFQHAERLNRRSMAVALYRAGITDPGPVEGIIEEAHFHYGKGNRPTLARGFPSIAMVFRSYQINQLTWLKNEIKAKRIAPAARSMAALVLLGGLRALPFAGAVLAAYTRLFQSDPEADAREALGDTLATVLLRGAPAPAGVSLTGSVAMGDIVPTVEPGQGWKEALGEWVGGVAADVPVRASRVTEDLRRGDWLRALEDASPEALRNPLAARRLYVEGAMTRRGQRIWDWTAGEQLHLTQVEAALKSLGFQPDRLKQQYDLADVLKIIEGERQLTKQAWADRLYLAGVAGDEDGVREVFAERQNHENAARARGRPDLVIPAEEVVRSLPDRLKPVNVPTKSMLPTFWRIVQQYRQSEEPVEKP